MAKAYRNYNGPEMKLYREVARACRKRGAKAGVVREIVESRCRLFVVGIPALPKNFKTGHRIVWQGRLHKNERAVFALMFMED